MAFLTHGINAVVLSTFAIRQKLCGVAAKGIAGAEPIWSPSLGQLKPPTSSRSRQLADQSWNYCRQPRGAALSPKTSVQWPGGTKTAQSKHKEPQTQSKFSRAPSWNSWVRATSKHFLFGSSWAELLTESCWSEKQPIMFVHGVNPLPLIMIPASEGGFKQTRWISEARLLGAESDDGILGVRRVKVQDL